ncbi:N-formylglutamate amidohydrolase [Acidisoma cellulosilytica]|uniref:N-formylglutamate amidohydrolase n=1 Tax=Acidisoma cellulosilyticum TaxID=2802395 RepID=A0A963Z6I3_9PROT|nr:N-formylglutamate amidohydrolase [Acidisoma cellulosilyticum]MCB8883434.1 N-formylglutamate amidohydrolase [Acidisoma cellulosilyticum]
MNYTAVAAPLSVIEPDVQTVPLVFSSAHSGADYDAHFLSESRLEPRTLRRSEDYCVDRLFAAAPDYGAPLLSAHFPRAYCDANREPWELDPQMFEDPLPPWVNTTSARIGAGLGTIPRVVASGETIYGHKLRFAEAEDRVRRCWDPYHAALRGLIEQTMQRFGTCFLIDCHSMPSVMGHATPDFVLGDAYGTACDSALVAKVEQCLRRLGYSVRRNDPYAGGYVTRHYGRPRDGVHALQIEVSRGLYMDERRIERHSGFTRLQRNLTDLIAFLALDGTVLS